MRRNKTRGNASLVRERALRDYYDKTSALDKGGKIVPISLSFPKPRKLVALRLDEESIHAIRVLAARKGLNYSTLMRMWITERLRREQGERG